MSRDYTGDDVDRPRKKPDNLWKYYTEVFPFQQSLSTAGKCKEHGTYHKCHCGMGVNVGSGMGEHWLARHISKVAVVNYPPWEAPNSECPYCYHLRGLK